MASKAARIARKKAKQQWQQTLHRCWSKGPLRVRKRKSNMWMTRGKSIFFFKPVTLLVRNKTARWRSHSSFRKRHQRISGPSLHLTSSPRKQTVGRADHSPSRPSDGRSSKASDKLNDHPGKQWMLNVAQTFSRSSKCPVRPNPGQVKH